MRPKTRIIFLVTTALLMVALLLPIACAGTSPAEGPERAVKVGHLGGSTGPIADAGLPISLGNSDWVRWTNEHDGIDGVKLDYKWIDTGYESPRAVASYQRLREWGARAIISFGTVPNDSIREIAEEDGMPIVCWGGSAEQFHPVEESVFFSTYESYSQEGRAGILWLKNNLPNISKVPKVALIRPDDAYGWAFANGAIHYADSDGFEIVLDAKLGHGALDASTQVRQAMEANAEIISFTYTPGTAAVVIRDARRLGFTGALLSTHYSAIDYSIGDLSEGAADGVYFNTLTYLLTDQRPGMQEIYDMLAAYHPDYDRLRPQSAIVSYLHGIISVKTLTEGLRAAINKVGYENLTNEAIWDGLESLNNVNIYDLMTVSFSPTDHTGAMGYGMFQYGNGDYKLVGDFVPSPPIADWERQGKFKWK